MSSRKGAFTPLGAAYAVFAIYMLAPLTMIVVMSLKDGAFMGFPITRWTLGWYAELFRDQEIIKAFLFSLYIAFASTAIALVVGVWTAVLLSRRFLGWSLVFALVCIPAVVPGVVSAISLRIFTRAIGIDQGALAIIIGHAVHSVPFVALMVLTRLSSMPAHLTEAARDLGADPFVAFLRVTLPFLRPALIGGAIFALLSSFDDFIRAFFLSAYQPTLPILIFDRLEQGATPSLAAVSTLILFTTVLLGFYAERLIRKVS